MSRLRLRGSLVGLFLIVGAAIGLPWIRANLSCAPPGSGVQMDSDAFTDEAAFAEASLLWDNPIESLLIWDKAVVARFPCPEPFTTSPIHGAIKESRVIEAYGPFGLTYSIVDVDCEGESERS